MEHHKCITSESRESFEKALNDLFAQGWQLVPGSIAVAGAPYGTSYVFRFVAVLKCVGVPVYRTDPRSAADTVKVREG